MIRSRDLSGAVSDFEGSTSRRAPVVFTLSMSLSPTFSAIMTLCLIDFIGLLGGVVALLERVARFLLFSIAQFS